MSIRSSWIEVKRLQFVGGPCTGADTAAHNVNYDHFRIVFQHLDILLLDRLFLTSLCSFYEPTWSFVRHELANLGFQGASSFRL